MIHDKPVRGKSDTWLTPPKIIECLGPFDLDPCCPENMPWKTATKMLTAKDDGLLSWPWKGRVWCNPPYGQQLNGWLERMAMHGNGIALTFVRTETQAFFSHVWPVAHSVFFFRGRLRFFTIHGIEGEAPTGPSMLIAYGSNNTKAIGESGLDGRLLLL